MRIFAERMCEGGCETRFTPIGSRQMFARGHRGTGCEGRFQVKKIARGKVKVSAAVTRLGVKFPERDIPTLNYRMALGTTEEELKELTREIDRHDNQIEALRHSLAISQGLKDKAVDRHELVSALADGLRAAMDAGQSEVAA